MGNPSTRKPSTTPTSTRFWDSTFEFYRALASASGEDINTLLKQGANIGGWFLALQGRYNRTTGLFGTLTPEELADRIETWVVLGNRELERQGRSVTTLSSTQMTAIALAVAEAVVTRLQSGSMHLIAPFAEQRTDQPIGRETNSEALGNFALDKGMSDLLESGGFIEIEGNQDADSSET